MRFQHTENSCAIRHGIQIRWRLLIRVVAMEENGVLATRTHDELCGDKKVVCVEETSSRLYRASLLSREEIVQLERVRKSL
jgi:hypothetical protein